MQTARRFLVFPLMALMMASSSAFAEQQHAVAPSQLASTVADHVARQDANRVAIHEALTRPDVHIHFFLFCTDRIQPRREGP